MNFITILLVYCAFGHTGKVLKYQSDQGKQMTLSLADNRVRIDIDDTASSEKNSILYLKSKKVTYYISHKDKEYLSLSEERLKALGNTLDQAMAMMDSLPPALQKQLKEKLQKKKKPSFTIQKKKDRVKVGQWMTAEYDLLKDSTVKSTVWVTPFDSAKVSSADFQIFLDMFQFLSQGLGNLIKGQGMENYFSFFQMKKLPGIPVRMKHKNNGEGFTLQTIEKKALPESSFSIPKGFKEKQMTM